MKQNQFKVLIVIAVITVMISAFAVTAYADDRAVYTSGECGAFRATFPRRGRLTYTRWSPYKHF